MIEMESEDMKFDYSYYKNRYGGELDESDFLRLSETAADMISLLIGGDVEQYDDDCVLRALCLETDELFRCGGSSDIEKETLGDYSVSYADEKTRLLDLPVSAEALVTLTRHGYLTRWA